METFIVRLWAPAPELAEEISPGELHGSVDHLRAQESYRFRTGDGLLEILRLGLRSVPVASVDSPRQAIDSKKECQ